MTSSLIDTSGFLVAAPASGSGKTTVTLGLIRHFRNAGTAVSSVKVGPEYIRINPTGNIDSVEDISNLLIKGGPSDKLIYLKDIAKVSRGYITPPGNHLRFNSQPALGMGISTGMARFRWGRVRRRPTGGRAGGLSGRRLIVWSANPLPQS